MADENSLINTKYFQSYPYQLNIVFIINTLYNILGSYKGVEIFTTALVNFSSIITAFTVCNVTNNRKLSIITAIMLNIFSTLCVKTYLPYTSNVGFIFPILTVYAYTSKTSRTKKILLMALFVVIGSRVKITTIIPFIAIAAYETYHLLREHDYKNILIGALAIVVLYIPIIYVHNHLADNIGFVYDKATDHGTIYYLAMGQNNATGGQYNPEISALGHKEFSSKEQRDRFFWDIAMRYFRERSAIGQIKFFASKIAFCWGETRLDHLYFCNYDKFLLILKHYSWYLALVLFNLGVFIVRDRRFYVMLFGICGVIGYLYLSEAGARYVLMYMPIVYTMAAWAVADYAKKTSTI